MKVIYKGLACLAALVLLVGQAEAAPQVASTLLESTDYEAFTVSSSDIGDTSNGATTVLTGGSPLGGNAHSAMIDGAIAGCCTVGNGLFPGVGQSLEILLDTSVNALGYDISSLVNTTGWNGSSRSNHQYVVALRPVGGSYTDILNVEFPVEDTTGGNAHNSTPPADGNPGVQLTINDDGSGLLGTGIDAIRYTFHNDNTGTSPESYQEFDVNGTPTPEPSAVMIALMGMVGLWGLVRRRR